MSSQIGTLLPFQATFSRETTSYFKRGKIFIDWLAKTKQSFWQVLPLHSTTFQNDLVRFESPYSSYGIGLNPQYLAPEDYQLSVDVAKFERENIDWVRDYAIFVALSREFGSDNWIEWEAKFQNPDGIAVLQFVKEREVVISQIIREQAILLHLFEDLKRYGISQNIKVWGDIPFYLPIRSPLAWRHQGAILRNSSGKIEFVAGSPGGKHFQKRQVWGFPLYNFDDPQGLVDIEKVWQMRLAYAAKLYDKARLDAAVRFFTYEKLHVTDPNKDLHLKGPGKALFNPLVNYSRSKGMDVYIEDISSLDMTDLQDAAKELGVAGISVGTMILAKHSMQIDPIDFNENSFHNNHIYFTSSHDTSPLLPYIESLTHEQRHLLGSKFDLPTHSSPTLAKSFRDYLVANCNTVVVAMQDWLLSKERINVPGVADDKNWNYKLPLPIEDLHIC